MNDTVPTPEVWLHIHRPHGRGPWYDVHIGVWNIWRCPCGEKFFFSDAQKTESPHRYVI